MEYERNGEELLAEGRASFDDEERNDETEPRVQVLTPSERNAYRGVTIDEGTPDGEPRTNIRFERGGLGLRFGRKGFRCCFYFRRGLRRSRRLCGDRAFRGSLCFFCLRRFRYIRDHPAGTKRKRKQAHSQDPYHFSVHNKNLKALQYRCRHHTFPHHLRQEGGKGLSLSSPFSIDEKPAEG